MMPRSRHDPARDRVPPGARAAPGIGPRSPGARRRAAAAAALGLAAAIGIAGCRAAERANGTPVILIVVDTLRADHLGLYGYERATSPALDRWAADAAVFDHAFSASSWTLPSFGSLYTGYFPSRHGAGFVIARGPDGKRFTRLDGSVRTLAEILATNGYATGAVVNNPFLHAQFGVARGFEDYDYAEDQQVRTADFMVDRALAWLDGHLDEPFFFVLHVFDPHLAYNPPERTRGRFSKGFDTEFELPIKRLREIRQRARAETLTEGDRGFITAAYDEEVAFVDEELDRFLRELEPRGLWGKALVVLTSDHGEELFDHGNFEHGHNMYQELLHVPLAFWGPGVRVQRRSEPVSLVDVAPTLLEAVGLRVPDDLSGRSLWSSLAEEGEIPDRVLVVEGNLYGPERKSVVRWPYKGVFNVANGRRRLAKLDTDPRETFNQATDPLTAEEAKGHLADLWKAYRAITQREVKGDEVEIDTATRDRLKELGYLQ